MKKRVGILTSGGDCPGLNATIRGVAKALYARMGDNVEIVGIANGYSGLINGDYREMNEDDFRGILTLGDIIFFCIIHKPTDFCNGIPDRNRPQNSEISINIFGFVHCKFIALN